MHTREAEHATDRSYDTNPVPCIVRMPAEDMPDPSRPRYNKNAHSRCTVLCAAQCMSCVRKTHPQLEVEQLRCIRAQATTTDTRSETSSN